MRSSTRRFLALGTVAAACTGALAVMTASPASAVLAVVPSPVVAGPIPATAAPGDVSKDYPFLATPIDLAARGYVEEEFFVSGDACQYSGVGLANATKGACFPYTTRIIVRRPSSQEAFNGTVLAEWQNVTAQYEVDHYWHESSEHFLRAGYAWVGISAQRAGIQPLPGPAAAFGINSLKAWNPTRYAPLDVTVGGTVLNDALRFDIYSQAVQALRSPTGVDPLGPLDLVDRGAVLAVGPLVGKGSERKHRNIVFPLAILEIPGFDDEIQCLLVSELPVVLEEVAEYGGPEIDELRSRPVEREHADAL